MWLRSFLIRGKVQEEARYASRIYMRRPWRASFISSDKLGNLVGEGPKILTPTRLYVLQEDRLQGFRRRLRSGKACRHTQWVWVSYSRNPSGGLLRTVAILERFKQKIQSVACFTAVKAST
jgi:hypothetical protein